MPLFLLFIVVPIIEIYFLVSVGRVIGIWPTVGLVLLMGALGAMLIQMQGVRLLSQVQLAMARGQMPTDALLNGLMIFVAGLMMLTPGFITDVLGLTLVFPPTRAIFRAMVKSYLMRLIAQGSVHVVTYQNRPPSERDVTPDSPKIIDIKADRHDDSNRDDV